MAQEFRENGCGKAISLMGILDTKDDGCAFVNACIEVCNFGGLLADVGVLEPLKIKVVFRSAFTGSAG